MLSSSYPTRLLQSAGYSLQNILLWGTVQKGDRSTLRANLQFTTDYTTGSPVKKLSGATSWNQTDPKLQHPYRLYTHFRATRTRSPLLYSHALVHDEDEPLPLLAVADGELDGAEVGSARCAVTATRGRSRSNRAQGGAGGCVIPALTELYSEFCVPGWGRCTQRKHGTFSANSQVQGTLAWVSLDATRVASQLTVRQILGPCTTRQ